jgi:hypothetical protein
VPVGSTPFHHAAALLAWKSDAIMALLQSGRPMCSKRGDHLVAVWWMGGELQTSAATDTHRSQQMHPGGNLLSAPLSAGPVSTEPVFPVARLTQATSSRHQVGMAKPGGRLAANRRVASDQGVNLWTYEPLMFLSCLDRAGPRRMDSASKFI